MPRDSQLHNPWQHLAREQPFILPSDQPAITAFNRTASPRVRIFDHLLPVPYLGLPDAPIVLLNLNPGYSPEDETRQTTARFQRAARRSLLRETDRLSAGFYFLDFRIEGSDADPGAGTRWWRRVFRHLPFSNDVLARSFFCIEYFPYRSREFHRLPMILDSPLYGFELLRLAMRRRALVIIMRSASLWHEAVPELACYPKAFRLRSPRNPTLTARNCSDRFQKIVGILERAQ
jgi:hypothetical protein